MGIKRPFGQVMWPEPPIIGESFLAWTVRTAHENVLPSCYTLLRKAGLAYTDKPIVALRGDLDVRTMATILGAPPCEVEQRMLVASPVPGFTKFNGVAVRSDSIATNARRFSPTTLARTRTHLAKSMVRTLPFCPASWEYLQDSCNYCHAVQRWRHAHDMTRCDRCCSDLTLQVPQTVDPALRSGLLQVASLLAPDPAARAQAITSLPSPLQALEAGEVWELLLSISMIFDPSLPIDRPARVDISDQRRLTSALAQGWEVLCGYPSSLVDKIDHIVRAGNRSGRRRLINTLRNSSRKMTLPAVQQVLRSIQSLYLSEDGSLPPRNLLVKPAARLLGVTETELADARDRVLKCRIGVRNGRLLLNLDRDEVSRLAKVRNARVGRYAAAVTLKIPPYGIDQLIDAGHVAADHHPWLIERFGSPTITTHDLNDFLTRLIDQASSPEDIDNPMPLIEIMRSFGGGAKPWGAVVGALLYGDTSFCLISPAIRSLDQVAVSSAEIARIRSLSCGRGNAKYSQLEALEILNLVPKHGAALNHMRVGEPGDRVWRLDGKRVEGMASEYASYAELTRRTGLFQRTIRDKLVADGVKQLKPFGWERHAAEQAFAGLLA